MRKALLVIVLIGAAFAGGALSQGTVPPWAKGLVKLVTTSGPGVGKLSDESLAQIPEASASGSIPAAPVPPLVVGPVPEESEPAQAGLGTPTAANSPPDPPGNMATQEPAPGPAGAANGSPDGGKALALADPPAAAKPSETPSGPASPEPAPLDPKTFGPEPAAPAKAPAAATKPAWADAPGSAPPEAVVPRSGPNLAQDAKKDPAVELVGAPNPQAPKPAAGADTWSDLIERMRALGVTHYWLEGEPRGPVMLRCVIPVAGRRAVGQQFEGEGPNPAAAAKAALRRVALWRATEAP